MDGDSHFCIEVVLVEVGCVETLIRQLPRAATVKNVAVKRQMSRRLG